MYHIGDGNFRGVVLEGKDRLELVQVNTKPGWNINVEDDDGELLFSFQLSECQLAKLNAQMAKAEIAKPRT